MLNLRHLHYFVVVAEELHFGRAAQRLRIGQPPLSQQIRRLEDELGVKLLQRSKRRVELTDAGRPFLEEARVLLAQAERARTAALRASRGEIGTLAIGIVPTADYTIVMDILRRFGVRYEQVRLSTHSLSTTAQIEAIHAGQIRAGFLRMPVRDPTLEFKIVSRERLVAALPATHPLAHRQTVQLRQLSGQPLIIFPRYLAPDYYDSIVSLFHQEGLPLNIMQETEHVQTILGLIASGFGIALLPESIQDFRYKGVVYPSLAELATPVETAIAYSRRDMSEVLCAFLSVVDEVIAENARRTA